MLHHHIFRGQHCLWKVVAFGYRLTKLLCLNMMALPSCKSLRYFCFVSYGMLQFSSKLLFLWKCHTLQKEMTCSQNITITFIIDNWNETVNHYVFVSCLGTAFWTHWKTFFRMWTSTFPCKPQTCSLVDASTGWFFFLKILDTWQ